MKQKILILSMLIASTISAQNDGTLDPAFASNTTPNTANYNNTGIPGVLAVPISPFLDIGVAVRPEMDNTGTIIVGAQAVTGEWGELDSRRFALVSVLEDGTLSPGFQTRNQPIYGPDNNLIQPAPGIVIDYPGFQAALQNPASFVQYSDNLNSIVLGFSGGYLCITAAGSSNTSKVQQNRSQAVLGSWIATPSPSYLPLPHYLPGNITPATFGGEYWATINGVYQNLAVTEPSQFPHGMPNGREYVYAPNHPQIADVFNGIDGVPGGDNILYVAVGSSQVDAQGFVADAMIAGFNILGQLRYFPEDPEFSFGENQGFTFKPRDTSGFTQSLNKKSCAKRWEEYNAVVMDQVYGDPYYSYIFATGNSIEYNSDGHMNDAFGFVSRFYPDGTFDPSFGTNGTLIINLGYPQKQVLLRAIAVDPLGSGDIYVGGDIADRLSDFPGAEVVLTDLCSSSVARANHACSLSVAPSRDWIIAKIKGSTGQLDPSFGDNGIVIIDMLGADDALFGLTLQTKNFDASEGTASITQWVIGAGQASDGNGLQDQDLGMVRLFATGPCAGQLDSILLDTSTPFGDLGSGFSGDGKVILESRSTATTVDYRSLFRAVTIDCSGNIVAIGQSAVGPVVDGFTHTDQTPTDVIIARFISSYDSNIFC